MQCHVCENDEPIPFRCRYCGRDYCSLYRLPPNHECPGVEEFLAKPVREREFIRRMQGKSGSPKERVASTFRNALLLRFSKVEIVHLIIGTGLVTAVGLSLIGYRVRWDYLAVFITAFMVHELGHKFLAQIYNAWAEFRVIVASAALTAFSALPIMPLKFIAPGAVFIGPLSKSKFGKVAWIGPLTNLAMGAGFVSAYLISSSSPFNLSLQVLILGGWFNAWIAIFNLIPFMGLDGSRIFGWSKLAWALTLAGAIGLFVGSSIIGGGGLLSFGSFL